MLVPFKSTDVIGTINLSVCFHCCFAARPSLRTEIWQLWMSFVLPASVWEVRWRVEAYELWHAYCNNDGKEEDSRERESKKKKEYSLCCLMFVSACNICCIRQWVLFCFLLFVFSGLRWYFCLPRDVSGWTRSATLRGGQVTKKHESKMLCDKQKTERGVWCG